jgi:F-type H+-transporting ATPase subunit epsilon
MPLRCSIATQDRLLFEGDVDAVIAPGVEGEMGILPKHTPLLASLGLGLLRVRSQGQEQVFTIAGGILEVQSDVATVLADSGEDVVEIDIARAEKARQRAEELLKQPQKVPPDQYAAIEAALLRSKLRLEAARRFQQPGRPRIRIDSSQGE